MAILVSDKIDFKTILLDIFYNDKSINTSEDTIINVYMHLMKPWMFDAIVVRGHAWSSVGAGKYCSRLPGQNVHFFFR